MRGGRPRAFIALLVIAAASAALLPARASAAVDVMSNFYSPGVRATEPGVQVTWRWLHGGHTVTAMDGSFDSGRLDAGETFSWPFNGGELRYRCTLHSTIEPSTGQCNGMCGVLREQTADVLRPTAAITEPANGQVVIASHRWNWSLPPASVRFEGTARDDRRVQTVRLWVELPNRWQEFSVVCDGCGTPTATWRANLALLPGRYEAFARATDPAGNIGTSHVIEFTVV